MKWMMLMMIVTPPLPPSPPSLPSLPSLPFRLSRPPSSPLSRPLQLPSSLPPSFPRFHYFPPSPSLPSPSRHCCHPQSFGRQISFVSRPRLQLLGRQLLSVSGFRLERFWQRIQMRHLE
ncbi:unnamed protein product [Closterium sp. NIES-54]